MILFSICLLGLFSFPLLSAQAFKAVAYGSRVFTVNSDEFSTVDEANIPVTIPAGDAVLSIAPSQGTLKQPDCIDVVNVNDIINFEDGELIFCYEGGPQMVDGVLDTLTFNIVGDNEATSTFEAIFNGSDPVVPFSLIERRITTLRNTPVVFAGSDFAFIQEDVTELTEFQILLLNVPRGRGGGLFDASGSLLEDGSIINNDDIITFVPSNGAEFCAPFPDFPLDECPAEDEDPSESLGAREFRFSIIFGEGVDEIIGEVLPFFYVIQTPAATDVELVLESKVFPVLVTRISNERIFFPFNSRLLFVNLLDEEQADFLMTVRFTVLNKEAFGLEPRGLGGVVGSSASCSGVPGFNCNLSSTTTPPLVNTLFDLSFLTLGFVPDKVPEAILRVSLNGGQQVEDITFRRVSQFEAVAFGSRVVSVDTQQFFSLDQFGDATLIEEGEAILTITPNQGVIRQPNCIDFVNVSEVISFQRRAFVFCYEGGPDMLQGVPDIVTFDIVGEDGGTASFTVSFVGGDPVIPVASRVLKTEENKPLTAFVNLDLAVIAENVDLIDDFQVRIDQLPSPTVGLFATSAGDPITNGMILNRDDVITFTPTADFFNCATFEDIFQEICQDIIADPDISSDQFEFSIIYRVNESDVVTEPVAFSILVELETVGDLAVSDEPVSVFLEDTVRGIAPLALQTVFLAVVVENGEDVDSPLSVRFTVVTQDILSLEVQPDIPEGILGVEVVPCPLDVDLVCEVFMAGDRLAVNAAIDDGLITLKFDANLVANATLQVSLNGDEKVETVSFKAVGVPPSNENGLSSAGVGILSTLGVLVGLALIGGAVHAISNKKKVSKKESTKEPEHTL